MEELPSKAVFQMNDTHPTIAVAELMRLLIDQEGLDWDKAWGITTKVYIASPPLLCSFQHPTSMDCRLHWQDICLLPLED